jgi:hypothetical protein
MNDEMSYTFYYDVFLFVEELLMCTGCILFKKLYASTCLMMNHASPSLFSRYNARCLNGVMMLFGIITLLCIADTPIVLSGMCCIFRSGSRSQVRSMWRQAATGTFAVVMAHFLIRRPLYTIMISQRSWCLARNSSIVINVDSDGNILPEYVLR